MMAAKRGVTAQRAEEHAVADRDAGALLLRDAGSPEEFIRRIGAARNSQTAVTTSGRASSRATAGRPVRAASRRRLWRRAASSAVRIGQFS